MVCLGGSAARALGPAVVSHALVSALGVTAEPAKVADLVVADPLLSAELALVANAAGNGASVPRGSRGLGEFGMALADVESAHWAMAELPRWWGHFHHYPLHVVPLRVVKEEASGADAKI